MARTFLFETRSRLTTIGNSGFRQSFLKNFTFPENIETIEDLAFFTTEFSPSGTLIIPAKVSKIGNRAFMLAAGITAVDIRSDRLAKPTGAAANFPLGNGLFQNVTGIAEIKLPAGVYDSYTSAERTAIFGTIPLTRVP